MSTETESYQQVQADLNIIHKYQCLDLCKECYYCLIGNTYSLQITCLHNDPTRFNCAVLRDYYDKYNTC